MGVETAVESYGSVVVVVEGRRYRSVCLGGGGRGERRGVRNG